MKIRLILIAVLSMILLSVQGEKEYSFTERSAIANAILDRHEGSVVFAMHDYSVIGLRTFSNEKAVVITTTEGLENLEGNYSLYSIETANLFEFEQESNSILLREGVFILYAYSHNFLYFSRPGVVDTIENAPSLFAIDPISMTGEVYINLQDIVDPNSLEDLGDDPEWIDYVTRFPIVAAETLPIYSPDFQLKN